MLIDCKKMFELWGKYQGGDFLSDAEFDELTDLLPEKQKDIPRYSDKLQESLDELSKLLENMES